jgi:hypothetical protein
MAISPNAVQKTISNIHPLTASANNVDITTMHTPAILSDIYTNESQDAQGALRAIVIYMRTDMLTQWIILKF